jgi:hypothetical protein
LCLLVPVVLKVINKEMMTETRDTGSEQTVIKDSVSSLGMDWARAGPVIVCFEKFWLDGLGEVGGLVYVGTSDLISAIPTQEGNGCLTNLTEHTACCH